MPKSILLLNCLLMLSSIILAIVGKIICVKLDYLFSLFSEAFRLAQGIFFRHAKELEGKKTNRKRKIRSICKAHRGRFFEKHPWCPIWHLPCNWYLCGKYPKRQRRWTKWNGYKCYYIRLQQEKGGCGTAPLVQFRKGGTKCYKERMACRL